MKKILIIIAAVAVMATVSPVKAGGVYDGPEPGTSLLGVRVGFDWGINVNVAYDYSLAKVWKGTFTIGGVAGVGFGYLGGVNIPIMARTTYRFNVVVPEWEVYAGVMLGLNVRLAGYYYGWGRGPVGFAGGFLVGTSYYFTEKFGVNLEFNGGTLSWANLGVKFKF